MPTSGLPDPRSLRLWLLIAVGTIGVSLALSAALDKPGDGNDPFLAELGNVAALAGMALLAGVAVVATVRALRSRG